jgi:hypothetical protein
LSRILTTYTTPKVRQEAAIFVVPFVPVRLARDPLYIEAREEPASPGQVETS